MVKSHKDIISAVPADVQELIFNKMLYADLKTYASTNKANRAAVVAYLTDIARRARQVLGLDQSMNSRDLVERVYHLNGYRSGDASGIVITDDKWVKGKNQISEGDHSVGGTIYGTSHKWLLSDEFHREDGPAEIKWRDDIKVKTESWYRRGKLHRVDGPAETKWKDGTKVAESWYHLGKLHRGNNKPAHTVWFSNRKSEKYYNHGKAQANPKVLAMWAAEDSLK